MQERNVIGSATATALTPFVSFYSALTPYIMIAIVLIIVDCRFGVLSARKRGEVVRVSRKWRRSLNKLVDYICLITLAGLFGKTYSEILGIPALSALSLLVVYGIELASIFNNYFEYRGVPIRISFRNIFKVWWRKISKDAESIIEKEDDKSADIDRD